MTADQVIELLGLEPMPAEGGMWTQTWRDDHGSGIYFLLRPGDFSALHRLDIAELWHHYAGAAVEMLLLAADGGVTRPVLGDDLSSGQRPFVAVDAGMWMAAATNGEWSLVGTTMAPPFDAAGFELGAADDLMVRYPEAAADIPRFTREEHR
ncbi:MAG TPA: cupin domain-containing protein [Acidimicrobiia bacterium]|nr:cupin domain-containing protein [Acidimicrobiia bacterium]